MSEVTATAPAPEPADGRARRAARTRAAIVEAMLELLEDDPRPSAARIAERAGTSERLIYHHFKDLEDLLGAAASRQSERLEARWRPIDPTLPRAERIERVAKQRADVLEWLSPIRRASLTQEPFSPQLRAVKARTAARAREQLGEVFGAELASRPAADRRELLSCLDAATSWGSWDALRSAGLSKSAARRAMGRTLHALLR